ncbi:hypothetical protein BGI08_06570 [Snodgrassella alvi]|nr:hypothetical protein BGI08_06570 [Snodgrassella alvi]
MIFISRNGKKKLIKKCNWVYSNIDIYLFGQEDKFSYPLCLLNEQNAMINELILLMNHNKILVNNEIQQYFTNIPEQKQYNIYFNLLTEKYALKFCSSLYPSTGIKECINRFLLTQYIPENMDLNLQWIRVICMILPIYLIKQEYIWLEEIR